MIHDIVLSYKILTEDYIVPYNHEVPNYQIVPIMHKKQNLDIMLNNEDVFIRDCKIEYMYTKFIKTPTQKRLYADMSIFILQTKKTYTKK